MPNETETTSEPRSVTQLVTDAFDKWTQGPDQPPGLMAPPPMLSVDELASVLDRTDESDDPTQRTLRRLRLQRSMVGFHDEDPQMTLAGIVSTEMAKGPVPLSDLSRPAPTAKEVYYASQERAQTNEEIKQAIARGLLTYDQVDPSIIDDRSNMIQRFLGLNNMGNTGSTLETIGDVLSLGDYAVSAMTAATVEDPAYNIGGFTIGFGMDAFHRAWQNKTTMMSQFAEKGVLGDQPEDLGWNMGVGLGLDIMLDPLNLITFGVGSGSSKLIKVEAALEKPTAKLAALALTRGVVPSTEVPGHVSLTLQRVGRDFYRQAAHEVEPQMRQMAAARNAERAAQGLPELRYYDGMMAAEQDALITEHMINNFDRLKPIVMNRKAGGNLGKWSPISKFIPGSASYESMIVSSAEKGLQQVNKITRQLLGARAQELAELKVEDLFRETASTWRKDRGVGNAFGLGGKYADKGAFVVLATKKLAGAAMAPLLDTFARGWDATPAVVDTVRRYEVGLYAAQEHFASSVYESKVFNDATPDELAHLSQTLEARGMAQAHLPLTDLGKRVVPVLDSRTHIPTLDGTMVPNPEYGHPMTVGLPTGKFETVTSRTADGKSVTERRWVVGPPDPNQPRRVRVKEVDAHADDPLADGPIGAYAPLSPRTQRMVDYFEETMRSILQDERDRGFLTGSVSGYVAHVWDDPAVQDLILKQLAAKTGDGSSIHSGNRFTQARLIATIHEAEELYGQGTMLTDPVRILLLRKNASLQLLARDALMKEVIRDHGTFEGLLMGLRQGAPEGLLAAAGRRLGVGVQQVLSLDQIYKVDYGHMRTLGFRENQYAYNRDLLSYLMRPLTNKPAGDFERAGRFEPTVAAAAAARGYNQDARLFTVVGDGTARRPLPDTFRYRPLPREARAVGQGVVEAPQAAVSFSVEKALDILADPSHPAWIELLADDVAYTKPELRRVNGWLKALNNYFVKHLDTPLEGFVPDVRKKVEAAWIANQRKMAPGTPTDKRVLFAKTEAPAARAEAAGLRAAVRAVPPSVTRKGGKLNKAEREAMYQELFDQPMGTSYTPPTEPSLHPQLDTVRARVLLAQAREHELLFRGNPSAVKRLPALHKFLDSLAAPREMRKLIPQLPTAMVDYLRAARRRFGIITDSVPMSNMQREELEQNLVRLGWGASELRQIARHLFDADEITNMTQADRVNRLLGQSDATRSMMEKERVTIRMLESATKPVYPEERTVVGTLDERGRYGSVLEMADRGPARSSHVGRQLAEERAAHLSAGEVPPERQFFRPEGSDRPTMPLTKAPVGEEPGVVAAPPVTAQVREGMRESELSVAQQRLQRLTAQMKVVSDARRALASTETKYRQAQELVTLARQSHRDTVGKLQSARQAKSLTTKDLKAARVQALATKKRLLDDVKTAAAARDAARTAWSNLPIDPEWQQNLKGLDRAYQADKALVAKLGQSTAPPPMPPLTTSGVAREVPWTRPQERAVTVYLDKPTAKLLREVMTPLVDPHTHPYVRRLLAGFDKLQNAFKANVTAPFTGSWGRDILGATAMTYLANGLAMFHPVRSLDVYHTMAYLIRESGGDMELFGRRTESAKAAAHGDHIIDYHGRLTTVRKLVHEEMVPRGILRGSVRGDLLTEVTKASRFLSAASGAAAGAAAGAVVGANVDAATGQDPSTFGAATNLTSLFGMAVGAFAGARAAKGDRLIDKTTKLLQSNWAPFLRAREMTTEIPARVITFLNGMHDTGSVSEASERVYNHLNNWHSLSVVERRWLRRANPFYNWMKLAFRSSGHVLMEHPERLSAILKAQRTWNEGHDVDPEDVPDQFSNALVVAGHYFDHISAQTLYTGLGAPIEDVAKMVAAVVPDLASTGPDATLRERVLAAWRDTNWSHENRQLYSEVSSRLAPSATFLPNLFANIDDYTGGAIAPNIETGDIQTRMQDGEQWAGTPWWLRQLVWYEPAVPNVRRATVNPRVAWAIGKEPMGTSRFIGMVRQIHNSADPTRINYDMLARQFLGVNAYRVDPNTGRMYENKRRLQKLRMLLMNVGTIGAHQEWNDVDKEDQDYHIPPYPDAGRATGRPAAARPTPRR